MTISIMEQLEEMFRKRELRPGSRLPPEAQLASALGVSRLTLREVLNGLKLFGIVRSRPGDGTYIQRSLSGLFAQAVHLSTLLEGADHMDVLDARLTLEPMLAKMATERCTRQHLSLLRQEVQQMEASLGNLEQYLAHDLAFHSGVMMAADSPVLKLLMEALVQLTMEARRDVTASEMNRGNLVLHERILEAIEAGDSAGAYRAMVDHLLDTREKYIEHYGGKPRRVRMRYPDLAAPEL